MPSLSSGLNPLKVATAARTRTTSPASMTTCSAVRDCHLFSVVLLVTADATDALNGNDSRSSSSRDRAPRRQASSGTRPGERYRRNLKCL